MRRRKILSILRLVFEAALVLMIVALFLKPPAAPPFWRAHVIYGVPMHEKLAALTFDDGPYPKFTTKLLDVLDKYHVKATFFMIGKQMKEYPDIVRDVYRRGHVIANHTYTHPVNLEEDSETQVIRELDLCEQQIENLTGKRTHLFRPPRGLLDGDVFLVAKEEGYTTVLWTVSADHHDAPTPQAMADRVVAHIRPGAIVLAHDGRFPVRWKDLAATPLIISTLRKQHYRFVTVPELLEDRNKGNLYYRLLNVFNIYPKP